MLLGKGTSGIPCSACCRRGQPQMDGRWMDRWMDGWIHRWMDGWMDGWVDGWMVGWIHGWSLLLQAAQHIVEKRLCYKTVLVLISTVTNKFHFHCDSL